MPASQRTVELRLKRAAAAGAADGPKDTYDVVLIDAERAAIEAVGSARLALEAELIEGAGITAAAFVKEFLGGDGGREEDGIAFGRYLYNQLFGQGEVRALWEKLTDARKAGSLALRLELIFPATDADTLALIPFELLADANGFLFRRPDATLVRAIAGLTKSPRTIAHPSVLVAWANPNTEPRLSDSLFRSHEERTRKAAKKAGLRFKEPPCSHATLAMLEERLTAEGGTDIVSLIAHGSPKGGEVWLHAPGAKNYPDDAGQPVRATDLARVFRSAKVDVALLWSCYGATPHPVSGSVAAALLREDEGGLAAVLASHAALRAEDTDALAERVLLSLAGASEGVLERAVCDARLLRASGDLQWAAPVYYARPNGGQSVTVQTAVLDYVTAAKPARVELRRGTPLPTHFRGRSSEIHTGVELVLASRLVSVVGMGGMGKTSVAQAIAAGLLSDGRIAFERALWVSLDSVATVERLRGDLASDFGISPDVARDDSSLARRIGDATALVVLDNAEDLLRTDRANLRALVRVLLADCKGVRLLVTTRERLEDPDEKLLLLKQLAPADAREVFVTIARPFLSPGDEASQELTSILEWLDGHPLSLVLVARQVGSVPLARIWKRLQTREAEAIAESAELELEPNPSQDPKLRGARLESCLALSYRPLVQSNHLREAAEMFAWLGHFDAGLPGVLAPLVFGEGSDESRWALVRRSMVEVHGTEQRLILPAPVRSYARARAATDIAEARRLELLEKSFEAMATWLSEQEDQLEKAEAGDTAQLAMPEGATLASLLRALEHDVVHVAGERAERIAVRAAHAVETYATLSHYAGSTRVATGLAERARKLLGAFGAPASLGQLSHALGKLYFRTGKWKDAHEAFDAALKSFRSSGNLLGEANAHLGLGEVYASEGRLAEAEHAYNLALALYSSCNSRLGEANAIRAFGELYFRTGRMKDAEEAFRKVFVFFQDAGSVVQKANALSFLGDVYLRTDRRALAEPCYLAALEILNARTENVGKANAEKALGDVCVQSGPARHGEAETRYRTAIRVFSEVEVPTGEADARRALGDLLTGTGRFDEAALEYRRAGALFDATGDIIGRANVMAGEGMLALNRADARAAFSLFSKALSLARKGEDELGVANAHGFLAKAAIAMQSYTQALVLLSHAVEYFVRHHDGFRLVLGLEDVAHALTHLGTRDEADAALDVAWQFALACDHPLAARRRKETGQDRPSKERIDAGTETLRKVFERSRAQLEERDIDVYALPAASPPPVPAPVPRPLATPISSSPPKDTP